MAKAKSNCFAPQVISDRTFEDAPEEALCPVEVEHIWRWYVELDEERTAGMDLDPITSPVIESWARLNRIRPIPFEVKALRAIDKAYMKFHRSKRKDESNG